MDEPKIKLIVHSGYGRIAVNAEVAPTPLGIMKCP